MAYKSPDHKLNVIHLASINKKYLFSYIYTLSVQQSTYCMSGGGQYTVPASITKLYTSSNPFAVCLVLVRTLCACYWSIHSAHIKQHTVRLLLVSTRCLHQTTHCMPGTGLYTVPTSVDMLYAWYWSKYTVPASVDTLYAWHWSMHCA